jgi:hypothetical protein
MTPILIRLLLVAWQFELKNEIDDNLNLSDEQLQVCKSGDSNFYEMRFKFLESDLLTRKEIVFDSQTPAPSIPDSDTRLAIRPS